MSDEQQARQQQREQAAPESSAQAPVALSALSLLRARGGGGERATRWRNDGQTRRGGGMREVACSVQNRGAASPFLTYHDTAVARTGLSSRCAW